MKFLSLILWQYSRKFAREIVLISLISLMTLMMNLTITVYMQQIYLSRATERLIDPLAVQVAVLSSVIPDYAHYETLHKVIDEFPDIPCGLYYTGGYGRLADSATDLILYNDDMITHFQTPLSRGQALMPYSGEGPIPILISYTLGKLYNPGDVLELEIQSSRYNDFNGTLQVIVQGIMSKDGYFVGHYSSHTTPRIQTIYGTNNLITSDLIRSGYVGRNVIVFPSSVLGDVDYQVPFPSVALLFPNEEQQKELLQEISMLDEAAYAQVRTIPQIIDESWESFLEQNSIYAVGFIMVLLLTAVSLVCYSIIILSENIKCFGVYYICGLSWSSAFKIMLVPCLIITAVSSVFGIVITPAFSRATIGMSTGYINAGSLLTLAFTFTVLIISSLILSVRIKKTDPLKLIR